MKLRDFTAKWTLPDYPPDPVSERDLRAAEERFGVSFPQDYRDAVLQVGLPRPTLALLHAIVERHLPLAPPANFHSPDEVVELTLASREGGMPDRLIAFADDDSGNMFCFDSEGLKQGTAEGRAIWFFDHDFDTTDIVAPSFDAWIGTFCAVEPVPD